MIRGTAVQSQTRMSRARVTWRNRGLHHGISFRSALVASESDCLPYHPPVFALSLPRCVPHPTLRHCVSRFPNATRYRRGDRSADSGDVEAAIETVVSTALVQLEGDQPLPYLASLSRR